MSDELDAALVRILEPGQDIVIAQASAFPAAIAARLPNHRDRLRGSRIFCGMLTGEFPDLPEVTFETMFPSGPFGTREDLAARNAKYCRQSLYRISDDFRNRARRADVVLAAGAVPNNGTVSFALGADYALPAARNAGRILIEALAGVNDAGPRSRLDLRAGVDAVESGRAIPVMPWKAAGDVALADNLLGWIPNGAALELGMGNWAGPLLAMLPQKRTSLRLHTGAFGDWLLPLVEAGALDNGSPLVATAIGGTSALYEAASRIGIELAPAHETHDPAALAAIKGFRAINSVLEVDLLGRANSENGGSRLGGLGGLPDFASAAARNADGLSILALPSESRGQSRIVVRLEEAHVSLGAELVDVIVTEQGSADLRGLNDRKRAEAILAIASPAHRETLRAGLNEMEFSE